MPIAASMLPEFDHEMKTTRSLLSRVPDEQSGWKPHPKSMLATFDRVVVAGREAIATASDDTLKQPWTLRAGTHVIVTMPRIAILRTLVMNHVIHHRGQLSVYLRLNDVPLPDIYGPTADSVR